MSDAAPDTPFDLAPIIADIVDAARATSDRGTLASYIPALARVDPGAFGIAVATADGRIFVGGDADVAFSIQSVSKVFALTLALDNIGAALWRRVGVEPSGTAFNSIVQLEAESGVPRNPFINAGAIVVADVVLGDGTPPRALDRLLDFIQRVSGDTDVHVDAEVAASEAATGYRNVALANYMRAFGGMANVEGALALYFSQCAIAMSCRQLALAGRFLMLDGRHPAGGESVVPPQRARRILSLMLTCGHYDGSGEFAFRVGIPGKSGVGGGILAVVPGRASIAAWSPGLNARGNSKLGSEALERLAAATNWSVFTP